MAAERAYRPDVFVVEDDPDTRDLLTLILEDAGHTVVTTADGMSALTRLRLHPTPLVVILDWWLPGMDGIAVLKAMLTDAPGAQRHVYLLLTALPDEARPLLAALPAELAVTLMDKPFDVDNLLAFVAGTVRHLHHQRRAGHGKTATLSPTRRSHAGHDGTCP